MSKQTVSEKSEGEEQKSTKQHVVRNVLKDFENEKAELEPMALNTSLFVLVRKFEAK